MQSCLYSAVKLFHGAREKKHMPKSKLVFFCVTSYIRHRFTDVPNRVGLGRLIAWHLLGGPVGPVSRGAATSDVEVGQTTYPVNVGRAGREGREKSEGQRHKDKDRERGVAREWGTRSLSYGGRAVLKYLCNGPPSS